MSKEINKSDLPNKNKKNSKEQKLLNNNELNSRTRNRRISYKNRTMERKFSSRGSLKPQISGRNSQLNLNNVSNNFCDEKQQLFDFGPDLEGIRDVDVYSKQKRRKRKKNKLSNMN